MKVSLTRMIAVKEVSDCIEDIFKDFLEDWKQDVRKEISQVTDEQKLIKLIGGVIVRGTKSHSSKIEKYFASLKNRKWHKNLKQRNV